ncbi:phosphotransferase family protein [Actinomadura sp. NPDC048394]|jgi:aminoglycoside phosphotransferase (APT) family kinase protein|uniref:phosphotransferase family protein n=1 Tax=Actinomadura sp. NPDC048394 TaxID=3158223 RepID=UPI0033D96E68
MRSAAPPGVAVSALESFLAESVPGLVNGQLDVRLLSGGRSNLTYLVTDGRDRWVLRRPPLGHVLATAHDMAREFRVLQALHPTDVPVPEPIVRAGPEVIGAPFYLMGFVEGIVPRERRWLETLSGATAVELAETLIEVLAHLHRIVPGDVGLSDLGRPTGYLDRQLSRWTRQLQASRSRDVDDLVRLGERLKERLPRRGTAALVHGDYRLDNVVVDPEGTQVRSVLDWEMATLGDPLTDLASAVVWWDGIRGLDSPVAAVPGDVPGYPSGNVLVEAYARRTGHDLAELPWYFGFAFYKIAVIFEGIHYRARQGLTVGEGFDRLGALVPGLVERGHTALRAWS